MRVKSGQKTAAHHAAFIALSEQLLSQRYFAQLRSPLASRHAAYDETLATRRAAVSAQSTKWYTLGFTPCNLLTICQQIWRYNQQDLNHQQCFKSSRRAHASIKGYAYKQQLPILTHKKITQKHISRITKLTNSLNVYLSHRRELHFNTVTVADDIFSLHNQLCH